MKFPINLPHMFLKAVCFLKDLVSSFLFPTIAITIAGIIYAYHEAVGFTSLDSSEKLGQLGDFFGGTLNPILSFFAFVILISTLRIQKSDSRALKSNHDEILESQKFFGLVSLTHESARGVEISFPTSFLVLDSLDKLDTKKSTYQNHLAIGQTWKELKSELLDLKDNQLDLDYMRIYRIRMATYGQWRRSVWQWVGSYFETILFMIQKYYIPERTAKGRPDDFFTRIIRHQMTTSERNILFYEMLNSYDYHRYMRPLHARNFWRGGGDGMDKHRLALIEQAELHHAVSELKKGSL